MDTPVTIATSADMAKLLPDSLNRKGCLLSWTAATALLWPVVGVYAQESAATDLPVTDMPMTDLQAHGIIVVPRVSLTQTFTDNVNLDTSNKQAEQITEVSPGIHIASDAGRLKGYFDYALRAIAYAQSGRSDSFQNALNTAGRYEAVDGLMYLDFGGAISQQAVNAFGTQSSAGAYSNANKVEVSNYRLSPYLQGHLGNSANYVLRINRLVTQSDSAAAPGTATLQSSINLDGSTPLKNLGWLIDVSRTGVDYSAGRYTEADLSDVGLSYTLTPQLSVFAKTGREGNNYSSVDKQFYFTSDVGATWDPSARTRVTASHGNRSFGEAHAVTVEHHTALWVLRFSDTRDVTAVPVSVLVPTTSVVSGFVVSALSLQRRQDLSLTLRGVRDTVTFVGTQSESMRVDALSTALDDLAKSSVHQVGASVSYLHRLTPMYSFGLTAALQQTSGALGLPETWLRDMSISLTGKVARNSSVVFGLRHSAYTGATSYDESAITLNLTVQF
jgi:hypothetical protein